MRREQVAALGLVLIASLLTSGCGSSGPAGGSTGTSPGSAATPPPWEAREAASPDPDHDFGFTIHITPTGFQPRWLVSACCRPVTWRNLTGATASISFDHRPLDSGPIPPGGTFTFTPQHIESITYHSGTDPSQHGRLQVNQTFES